MSEASIHMQPVTQHSTDNRINAVRQFNRFITRQIGVLHEGLLQSPYTLTEARILFEIAQNQKITATDLTKELGLDAGYLSRILTRLEQQGIVEKVRSGEDARQRFLHLTTAGEEAFMLLNQRSAKEVGEMLDKLSDSKQQQLVEAMQSIQTTLSGQEQFCESYRLREPEAGDMGWITHRHGVLYAQEYGWDARFEALVAQISADFINNFKPDKERCWIAEKDHKIVGSVMIVEETDSIARLRVFYVEPHTRGLGIGNRLIEESIQFAKETGYEKIVLSTYSVLSSARRLYQKHGFQLVESEQEKSFGHELLSETWELVL